MIEQDRVTTARATREDEDLARTVRPKTLAEYIGQAGVKQQMGIFIEAARRRMPDPLVSLHPRTAASLGLTGRETYAVRGLTGRITPAKPSASSFFWSIARFSSPQRTCSPVSGFLP